MSVRHSRVATKICLKITLLNFWIKLTQKGYLRTKKMKIFIEFYIFKLIKILNFSFNKQFWFSEKISEKSILLVENTKNEHHYWILHIEISLSTNFQFKLTIAYFWTKFAKKGSYFQSKTDKIDTTIEFCIFELIFVSNFTLNLFLNILKISKISLFWTSWKKNWLCLASWVIFILKLYKAFQKALSK